MSVGNIVDISRLKVKVNVSERDVVRLRAGELVTIKSDVYHGVTYSGRVETIGAKGDEAHTYPVEIYVTNDPRSPLKAGMFARVEFTSLSGQELLTLPRIALLGSARDAKVYVVENGIARLRNIVVGAEFGSYASIVSGLSPGERVVINGQNTLFDGVAVNEVK
jgi:RND family efflux transporter MFP subunit